MKTECSTHFAVLGTGRAPMIPCLPAHFSRLGCQPCGWRLSGKRSRILPQNKYQAHLAEGQKDVKLPFLELPVGPAVRKDGARQNGRSPHVRSNDGLERKYTYFHFSSPVRLAAKPPACKPRCDFLMRSQQHGQLLASYKPSAYPTRQSLMVSGVTCGPQPRPDTSLLPQIRPKMEIHVYVPNGKENTDAKSLDEGFLEEMDNRPSSLRLPDS